MTFKRPMLQLMDTPKASIRSDHEAEHLPVGLNSKYDRMMKAIPKARSTRYADICARNNSHDAYSVVPLLHSAVLPNSGSTADLPCWLSQILLTLDDEHPLRGLLSGQDAASVYQENGTRQSDYLKSSVREIQEDYAIFAYSPTRHFSDPSVHRIGFHEYEARRLAMKVNQEMRASDTPLLTGSSDTGLSWTYDSEQAGSYDWLSSMPTSFLDFQHHSLGVAHPDEPIFPLASESSDHYKYVYGEAPPFSTPGPTSVLSFQNTDNSTFLMDDNLIFPEMRMEEWDDNTRANTGERMPLLF